MDHNKPTKSHSGLPLAHELMGAIKAWRKHELRFCDCPSVRMNASEDMLDSACHVWGTEEHKEQALRSANVRAVAHEARMMRAGYSEKVARA